MSFLYFLSWLFTEPYLKALDLHLMHFFKKTKTKTRKNEIYEYIVLMLVILGREKNTYKITFQIGNRTKCCLL